MEYMGITTQELPTNEIKTDNNSKPCKELAIISIFYCKIKNIYIVNNFKVMSFQD